MMHVNSYVAERIYSRFQKMNVYSRMNCISYTWTTMLYIAAHYTEKQNTTEKLTVVFLLTNKADTYLT